MPARKVLHVISSVEKSLAFEWLLPRLARECDLRVILLNPGITPLEIFLREHNVPVDQITLRGKRDFPLAFFRLLEIFLFRRPDVVHIHLFDAQRLALPAAWLARIRKRIYTRHNSTLHHRYHPSGIKYDRWSNGFATDIVSVSQATDYALLELEGVSGSKVTRIPHGFDFQVFAQVTPEREEALRKKWNIPTGRPVIGLVSRFIEWKGLQYALPAILAFQREHPETVVIIANAQGPYATVIDQLIAEFPGTSIIRIPFEQDVIGLFRLFDMFVHVPIDEHAEAFGQVYIEALASGIPSIVTLSGVAKEFVQHGVHAWVVDYKRSEAITEALEICWADEVLRERLAFNGESYVKAHFEIQRMISLLKTLYNG